MKLSSSSRTGKLRAALVAGLLLAGVSAAYAAMWTGLPAATSSPTALNATTLPLTGVETGAFDTSLSGGRNPQTETISVDQLKTYMYGNGGTASATPNTTVFAAGTGATGAATCNTSRCIVNSDALTTAATTGFYTLTVSNTSILSTSIIQASVTNISNTSTGTTLRTVTPNNIGGTGVIVVKNEGGISFNGTIRVSFTVVN